VSNEGLGCPEGNNMHFCADSSSLSKDEPIEKLSSGHIADGRGNEHNNSKHSSDTPPETVSLESLIADVHLWCQMIFPTAMAIFFAIAIHACTIHLVDVRPSASISQYRMDPCLCSRIRWMGLLG